jgi:hypothetical protein
MGPQNLAAKCLGLAACLGMTGVACATSIDLRLEPGYADHIDVGVIADGHAVCTIKAGSANAGPDNCRFDLPAATHSLIVRGSYQRADKHFAGEQQVTLLDFAVANSPAAEKNYRERVVQFAAATDRFAREHLPKPLHFIEPAGPVDPASIEAAEKRLGFALPEDFVSLQHSVGAIAMNDSRITPISQIDNAYVQMLKVWGTPEDALQEDYSESFRALLKTSVLLFTESGDGYSGLLYNPGASKTCGSSGTYYWTSEEGGTHVLKNPDASCMNFAQAFHWILNGLVLDRVAEAIGDVNTPTALIDSSSGAQTLRLSFNTHADAFDVYLRGQWHGLDE